MTNQFQVPSSFRVPAFLRPRRSFHRLRSFHLSPAEAAASSRLATTQTMGGAESQSTNQKIQHPPANLVIPLRGSTIVTLAIIASLFFIMSISFAFLGADVEDPYFKMALDKVAESSPGIVLIGDSVDVDIDEPSVTVRWSILACGQGYVLPESTGVHGSNVCGLPSLPLRIFVDNAAEPAAVYDPSTIPINKATGHRRNIQNLVQFDSDHVLDVHNARLYPFDTYFLTSTLRAVGFSNESIPIQKLATVDVMSSFDIGTADVESFSKTDNGTVLPSRDIDMHVARPGSARFFTLLLFTVSWVLTHVTIGHVVLARRITGMKPLLKHLVSSGAILISIPQLRNSMPDAPGLDGVLIDTIGYFPQMIISSISTIILLLILAVREFDIIGIQAETQSGRVLRLPSVSTSSSITYPPHPHPIRTFSGYRDSTSNFSSRCPSRYSRPPPSPHRNSTPAEIAEWERYRMSKHLTGQFVFPPVQTSTHRSQTSSQETVKPLTIHRRVTTMTRLMEAGQVPRSYFED
ncbi:hypothetical protein P691DRAFT_777608 [Macrolepiota fuliginosa MF-IS2]|uniref:Uncharacterized protein n=1 Tax=Macrolepiota fuliginosa MF-IS2 TaxID=1400762 RepID=A0A9P5X8R0_9AGAR|nr:hypothetical protein P691DRAFT_777608 [Macrolepiota fuliginosa MF-IS2]